MARIPLPYREVADEIGVLGLLAYIEDHKMRYTEKGVWYVVQVGETQGSLTSD